MGPAYPSNRLCIYRGILCITYSVLITIRIYNLFHYPKISIHCERNVKDYVPVDSESVTHNMWVLLFVSMVHT